MFDYAPVGLAIAAAGLVCLTLTFRLLPKDRRGGASLAAIGADPATILIPPWRQGALSLAIPATPPKGGFFMPGRGGPCSRKS